MSDNCAELDVGCGQCWPVVSIKGPGGFLQTRRGHYDPLAGRTAMLIFSAIGAGECAQIDNAMYTRCYIVQKHKNM